MNTEISNQRSHGMALLESLVVMVLLAVLVSMLAPAFSRPRQGSRINCSAHLKEIGTAFRIWEDDHMDAYPWEVSTNEGGSKEYASGPEVFRHFQAMQNEMGQVPKTVLCPADKERFAATNFTQFNNSNLSYFAGITVAATNTNTDLFLCGDRNLVNEIGPQSNRLWLTTNDSVAWTIGIHGDEKHPAGNVLFSDGTVQQLSTTGLRQALQKPGVAPAVVAVP